MLTCVQIVQIQLLAKPLGNTGNDKIFDYLHGNIETLNFVYHFSVITKVGNPTLVYN